MMEPVRSVRSIATVAALAIAAGAVASGCSHVAPHVQVRTVTHHHARTVTIA